MSFNLRLDLEHLEAGSFVDLLHVFGIAEALFSGALGFFVLKDATGEVVGFVGELVGIFLWVELVEFDLFAVGALVVGD